MNYLLYPLLIPISFCFGFITRIRNLFYDFGFLRSFRSKLPVISVGNILVGGSGKTPSVIFLCNLLSSKGYRPIVLSRGYKGKAKGPQLVTKIDSALDVGDEPKLMFQRGCIVVVAKNKVSGLKFIEERDLGELVILDDGFQSRYISRDFDIVCVDARTEKAVVDLEQGHLLPWGKARENLDRSINRIDALFIPINSLDNTKDALYQRIRQKFPSRVDDFKISTKTLKVQNLFGQTLPAQSVGAFTGIANPQKFFDTLKSLGFEITKTYTFSDHHTFQAEDLIRINRQCSDPLVCSEKDIVKIAELELKSLDRVYYVPIDFVIDQNTDSSKLLEISKLQLHKK